MVQLKLMVIASKQEQYLSEQNLILIKMVSFVWDQCTAAAVHKIPEDIMAIKTYVLTKPSWSIMDSKFMETTIRQREFLISIFIRDPM